MIFNATSGTLKGSSFLIVNDDRWDCVASARGEAVSTRAGVPLWFAELRQVLDDRGGDPLTGQDPRDCRRVASIVTRIRTDGLVLSNRS